MGGLAEHRAQLCGAALGDVPVRVAIAGLERARHEPAVAAGVLGTREAGDVGEHRDRRESDDRSDAGDGLERAHAVAQRSCLFAERQVEGADLRGGLAPDGVVMLEVTGEIPGHHIRGEQTRPMGIGAQTAAATALAAGSAQESLDGVDLRDLDAKGHWRQIWSNNPRPMTKSTSAPS
jgi:hypothetical protein